VNHEARVRLLENMGVSESGGFHGVKLGLVLEIG
jgi:hypothetical protein